MADAVTQQFPEPVTVHEALPRFTTLSVVAKRLPIETVYVAASMSAPPLSANSPVQVKLSPRVKVEFPEEDIDANVFPADVIVFAFDPKKIGENADNVTPVPFIKLL